MAKKTLPIYEELDRLKAEKERLEKEVERLNEENLELRKHLGETE